jgi:hypothetical protein
MDQDQKDTLIEAAEDVDQAIEGNGDLIDAAGRLAALVYAYVGTRPGIASPPTAS